MRTTFVSYLTSVLYLQVRVGIYECRSSDLERLSMIYFFITLCIPMISFPLLLQLPKGLKDGRFVVLAERQDKSTAYVSSLRSRTSCVTYVCFPVSRLILNLSLIMSLNPGS